MPNRKQDEPARGAEHRLLFCLYAALMLYLLFFHRLGTQGDYAYLRLNLIPGKTIASCLLLIRRAFAANASFRLLRYALVNLLGNVAVFVPLGWFLPCLWARQRRFGWYVLTVILLVTAIETVQFGTRLGSCDVDDLILNVIGACLGFLLFAKRAGRTGNGREDVL